MNRYLLVHVSVALFVATLAALGGMHLAAAGVAAYAIFVALNKSATIAEAVSTVVVGAFTAGFITFAIFNFDSGRYMVAVIVLMALAASWMWTLRRQRA